MSTLGEITFDDIAPRGKPLPDGTYKATVIEATLENYSGKNRDGVPTSGTRLKRTYGNLRTKDGATEFQLPNGDLFRIGNRKLFARDWIDHTDTQQTEIGNTKIKQEAVSAGIVVRPEKGQKVSFDYADKMSEYTSVLLGRDVTFDTKQKTREKDGAVVKGDDGQPIVDVNISGYRLPA